jgi:hypothetical protein
MRSGQEEPLGLLDRQRLDFLLLDARRLGSHRRVHGYVLSPHSLAERRAQRAVNVVDRSRR